MSFLDYWRRNQLLKEIGYPTYLDYLKSDLWAEIREKAYLERGTDCRACGYRATTIHHKSYSRKVLLGENIGPLVPLCSACHNLIEFDRDGQKRSLVDANAELMLLITKLKPIRSKPKSSILPPEKMHRQCRKCGQPCKKTMVHCKPCFRLMKKKRRS